MKTFRKILVVLLGAVPVLICRAEPVTANGIIAIVNDSVITYRDYRARLGDDMEMLQRRYGNRPAELAQKMQDLEKERIEELVERQLVLQEFKTAGYILPEALVDTRIQEDIKSYGDRLTLTKTLQAEGMTYEKYKTQMRERAIVELMWRQKVPIDPLISPVRIQRYYNDNLDQYKLDDEVKLRLILLTNAPADKVTPRKLAGEILTKINEGAPFAEMAKVYSQQSQYSEGSDVGWIQKKVLREDLRNVAFSLKPGEHSDLIVVNDGVYIAMVEDARPAHTRPLSEVREDIEATLKATENKRLRKQWVERLKAKAFIRYF